MQLRIQKKLAAQILGISHKKIRLDQNRLEEIKEAITKADIKGLIKDNAITAKPIRSTSRGKAREKIIQRRKGRQRGMGHRKGTANARLPKKEVWINKIRLQRSLLKDLRSKNLVSNEIYRSLYNKAKGGFFRNKRHMKLFIEEHNLITKKNK